MFRAKDKAKAKLKFKTGKPAPLLRGLELGGMSKNQGGFFDINGIINGIRLGTRVTLETG